MPTDRSRWAAALDLPGLAAAVLTMSSVLLSFASALVLEHYAHLHADVAVLAVVMAMTLARSASDPSLAEFGRRVVTLPIVAYLAGRVGHLMVHHVVIGDVLFTVALSSAVWLRRFGTGTSKFARLITLPFIGVLVVPVPVSAATASSLWPVVIALIALGWVTIVGLVGHAVGVAPRPEARAVPAPRRAGRSGIGALPPSTKMALQLAVGLGVAFAVGHWLYPQHWAWLVLSCYLVCSGNRGRGDVVHKGVQRVIGAGLGTIVATLISGTFDAGNRTAVVLIFVVLALATWLRRRSYGIWAAAVTGALALLNGYYGISGSHELVQRVGGVFLGAAIGVAASWWLLPIRSGDVFRRRAADGLSALSDYLAALRTDAASIPGSAATFESRVALLEQVLPAHRMHHRTIARLSRADGRAEGHVVDVIGSLGDLRTALGSLHARVVPEPDPVTRRTLGLMARTVGAVRRRMIDPEPVETSPLGTEDPELVAAVNAVNRLDASFTVELWRRHGGHRPPASR